MGPPKWPLYVSPASIVARSLDTKRDGFFIARWIKFIEDTHGAIDTAARKVRWPPPLQCRLDGLPTHTHARTRVRVKKVRDPNNKFVNSLCHKRHGRLKFFRKRGARQFRKKSLLHQKLISDSTRKGIECEISIAKREGENTRVKIKSN